MKEVVLHILNSFHPSLEFTMEAPPPPGHPIAFLDLTCTINSESRIEFFHYHKPSQTTRAIPFHSYHPLSMKLATIKQDVKRAAAHTSDHAHLSSEFRYIFHKYLSNGYPVTCIAKYVNYRWAHSQRPKFDPPLEKVFLPYIAPIHSTLSHATVQTDRQFITLPHCSIKAKLQKPKPARLKTHPELQKNIIYGIPCLDCPCSYIGQTKQVLKDRINKHKSEFRHMCPNNSLVQHYTETGHTPNFANLQVYYKSANFRTRLNLEAICINACNHPISNHILPQLPYLNPWNALLFQQNITIKPSHPSAQ